MVDKRTLIAYYPEINPERFKNITWCRYKYIIRLAPPYIECVLCAIMC